MDAKSFVEKVNHNTEAIFQEFKFRTLGVVSLYQDVKDLHQIAEALDSNQETIYNKLRKLALKILSTPAEDYIEEIMTRDKKIQDLTHQVSESNQVITDLLIKSRQKTGSVEKMTSSPFSQYTQGGSKVTRSVRVEDPEQYFNESGKDLLDFDAWRLGIEACLGDNADWFDTEDQRISYVMRRLAERASRETVPFLKSSNPERFRNAEEMLDHLENQYSDPDRRRKAENDWENLRMTYPESYGRKGDQISLVRFQTALLVWQLGLVIPAKDGNQPLNGASPPRFKNHWHCNFLTTALTLRQLRN
ncbi:hypothetical protein GcC1_087030 [Golovinomyces cichoracearum]|uniref:Uncharacterized protein n=1 Tax=Golovinomyces cichoracearum TaxID=62708 RepID=A0A420IHI9_9PEZI|nr:hypothetical protein GcC1_087030 [Golovinomyces cichoracearum]